MTTLQHQPRGSVQAHVSSSRPGAAVLLLDIDGAPRIQTARQGDTDFHAGVLVCAVVDAFGDPDAAPQVARTCLDVVSCQLSTSRADQEDAVWHHQLRATIEAASDQLIGLRAHDPSARRAACTVAIVVLCHDRIHVANVGGHVLRVSNGQCERLSRDDTLQQDGPPWFFGPGPDFELPAPTARMLGEDVPMVVFTQSADMRPRERLVLCSDGPVCALQEDDIAHIVTNASDADSASRLLHGIATEAGVSTSVVVVIERDFRS